MAKGAGLPIDKAAAAVATLDGAELSKVVEQAKHVEDALAGGQGMKALNTAAMIAGLAIALFIILVFAAGDWLAGY